ncbi:hypothetical protein A8C32_01755 [Flavivirga aquatica]|uniref:Secretion system C-terminal sorting domain-containing protein n=2 Tax=Flavivirga aquatica TaxID=1849968 RepID=A0A1E5TA02_9FLAO|nr:hypothetical protein A8C32_01755 [Flavivirga aquatica]
MPNPVSNVGNLIIDASVNENQKITYAFYTMQGNITGPLKELNINKGCNQIIVDLASHSNFLSNTMYVLIVNGNGWTKSIQIVTNN